ncbi:MAG: 23S rRNA (uracil(1939)-C(5))-methyltransferase RlmD [Rikenellaceae bacterium]|nr:23S rRNA (uracil(1939)-C(5))-methyltransferase RlmD [Rikenellaceae bacterium]
MSKGKNKKQLPVLEDFEITAIAAEGKALGRYGDMVVFVPYGVPGDIVDVRIVKKHRRYMEGRIAGMKRPSPMRTEPQCEHFGVCGGCKWQNIPYEQQLRFKTAQVSDQLRRLGGLEIPEPKPALPSEDIYFYRNKLEFTFCDRRWYTAEEIESAGEIETEGALGFHIPGMFDKVLDIRRCWLQEELSNAIRLWLKIETAARGLTYYNQRSHEGFMRNVVIRTASTGEIMVILVVAEDKPEKYRPLLEGLGANFPQITSLMYVINGKWNDSIADLEPQLFRGRNHIFEQMEGLKFKIGPKSFYQTNSKQAYKLYSVALEFASLNGDETVYDLYTGTGTIANFVAGRCAKVVGIEYIPEAIADAKVNSQINGIGNTSFFAGDMKDILDDAFIGRHGRPDVVILDPPRAGVHEDVVRTILRALPERIVYVSCNPATQARDLALFCAEYRITDVQPVDMFPHTHHVENVVKLVRNR